MEILQLKYFLHAARTENFSHTAQYFRVPTSGISASIKKLEKELGVTLFDRTANRIQLNDCGRVMVSAIEQADAIFRKARNEVLDIAQAPAEELNILVLTNRQTVTQGISEFKRKNSKVSFNIYHSDRTETCRFEHFDVIITDQDLKMEFFDKTFWLREEVCLAVPKNHPLSEKTQVLLEDFVTEKFICLPKGSSLRRCVDTFFEEQGAEAQIAIECDDPLYVRKYLTLGLGITFFPAFSWKDHLHPEMKLVHMKPKLYRNSYIYVNRCASNQAKNFVKILLNLENGLNNTSDNETSIC